MKVGGCDERNQKSYDATLLDSSCIAPYVFEYTFFYYFKQIGYGRKP